MATWDKAGTILHGTGGQEMTEALECTETPQGKRRVSAILISTDFQTGAALHQWDTAEPIQGPAWDKFFAPPYMVLYDGGDVWVMGVERPLEFQ